MPRCMTMLVETHFDDACLALSHALAMRVFPAPVRLVTVFSRTDPALATDPTRDVRLNEGRRFCDAFGLTLRPLGFEDRFLPDAVANSDLVRRIKRTLLDELRRIEPAVVLCPRPYGRRVHSHHAAVHHATTSAVAESERVLLALYDDLPYSRIPMWTPLIANAMRFVPFVLPLDDGDLRAKIRAMGLFASQMNRRPSYYDAVQQPVPGGPPGASETVWLPRNLAAALGSASGGDAKDLARVLGCVVSREAPINLVGRRGRCAGPRQLLRSRRLVGSKTCPTVGAPR